ncbi:mitochondrial 39S ribosomal protein L47 domain-containing protein, putative [Eimeria tenella]|uniref:Large ribosomal subunit protein uL29m n=1 Tax=Eimeria tenella TaxID=5802 RepID=U6KGX2_EIMTE|nr:mitochondrial 39S ribosomal protein L47 domain-containing protein, putative [Eimeria tenella]CDJ37275.1 mitochondrial 39S ribosomal protein L47 domain-containing protein, putative [Eimeria tenella]|eukprot:XP_013228113.1 mitochondrial 39S ribosomal protein L47 domain-containing protein, putative [Eimeria tenella]
MRAAASQLRLHWLLHARGYLDPSLPAAAKHALAVTGDAWPARLLRNKSFEDLHKLWFVLLKEKNLLLGERWAAWQTKTQMKHPERLKKVKLSMKRILTVLSRRAIHEQCLFAKRLLQQQQKREALELQRHALEELLLQLQQRVRLQQQQQQHGRSSSSLACLAWQQQLEAAKAQHEEILIQLKPLREETQSLLAPSWQYEKRYSDLPGRITWRREALPVLQQRKKVFKF